MKLELCELLEKDGFRNVQLAVGADIPEVRNITLADLYNIYHLPLISPDVLDSLVKSPILDNSFDGSKLINLDDEITSHDDNDSTCNEDDPEE